MAIYASSFTFNDHEFNWAVSLMLYCNVHILMGMNCSSDNIPADRSVLLTDF